MANQRIFPPCPECGAQRRADGTSVIRPMETFYANDGEIPGYYLKCRNCGHNFLAGIFALPPGASHSALDDNVRERRRNQKRKYRGYHGVQDGIRRIESDRLVATIAVKRGEAQMPLRRRLNAKQTRTNLTHTIE